MICSCIEPACSAHGSKDCTQHTSGGTPCAVCPEGTPYQFQCAPKGFSCGADEKYRCYADHYGTSCVPMDHCEPSSTVPKNISSCTAAGCNGWCPTNIQAKESIHI